MLFVLAMTFARQISPAVSNGIIVFFRSLFGFFLFLPFFIGKSKSLLKTQRLPLHLLRVGLSSFSIACTYYTYRNLPMATASSIGYTEPLLTYAFAFLILKEKIAPLQWVAIALGYVGVLMIFKPYIFEASETIWIALIGNIAASLALISTKRLSDTELPLVLLFFSTVATLLFSSLYAFCTWQTPSLEDLKILSIVAACASLGNLLFLYALKFGQSHLVASLGYTRLLLAFSFGFLFFHEIPSRSVFVGSAMIVFATYWALRQQLSFDKKLKN